MLWQGASQRQNLPRQQAVGSYPHPQYWLRRLGHGFTPHSKHFSASAFSIAALAYPIAGYSHAIDWSSIRPTQQWEAAMCKNTGRMKCSTFASPSTPSLWLVEKEFRGRGIKLGHGIHDVIMSLPILDPTLDLNMDRLRHLDDFVKHAGCAKNWIIWDNRR